MNENSRSRQQRQVVRILEIKALTAVHYYYQTGRVDELIVGWRHQAEGTIALELSLADNMRVSG